LPYPGVVFRLLLGELAELVKHAAGDALADRGEQRALLDHLARYVERQVGRIDHAAHEAQITRQKLRFVGDEDAPDIELHASLAVGVEQVERARSRHESQRAILLPPL